MKTPTQRPVLYYIHTARSASASPVKIDRILKERIKAFKRAKLLNQATKTTR